MDNKSLIICDFCNSKSFKSSLTLTKHFKKGCHGREFFFECPTCDEKQYKCFDPLKAIGHVSKCVPKGNYDVECGQCFLQVKAQQFALHYHDDILKFYFKPNPFKFQCDTCDLKLPNREDLRHHRSRHTKPDYDAREELINSFKRYSCGICFVSLFTKKQMTDHMTRYHELKIGKEAVVKRRVQKNNKNLGNGQKPVYSCYVCEDKFYCRAIAIHHVRVCEEEHGYKTKPPEKVQFLKPTQVFQESQERVYCDYCHINLSNWTRKNAQKEHMQVCKKKYSKLGSNSMQKVYCPKCNKDITKNHRKQRHIRTCRYNKLMK